MKKPPSKRDLLMAGVLKRIVQRAKAEKALEEGSNIKQPPSDQEQEKKTE